MNEFLSDISRWGVLIFVVTSMLELGLSLTLAEVMAPLKNVRLIALSIMANFLVVPLLAVSIAKAYALYWLGVVDEVTGSGLQSDREMIEMILSTESATRKP
jgi:predicted Na+-dependent transporter